MGTNFEEVDLVCLCVSFPLNFITLAGWVALIYKTRHSSLQILRVLSILPAFGNALWIIALNLFYFKDGTLWPIILQTTSSILELITLFTFAVNHQQLSLRLRQIVSERDARESKVPKVTFICGLSVCIGTGIYGCFPSVIFSDRGYGVFIILYSVMAIASSIILLDAFCRIHRQTNLIANKVTNLRVMAWLMACFILYAAASVFFFE